MLPMTGHAPPPLVGTRPVPLCGDAPRPTFKPQPHDPAPTTPRRLAPNSELPLPPSEPANLSIQRWTSFRLSFPMSRAGQKKTVFARVFASAEFCPASSPRE